MLHKGQFQDPPPIFVRWPEATARAFIGGSRDRDRRARWHQPGITAGSSARHVLIPARPDRALTPALTPALTCRGPGDRCGRHRTV